MPTNFKNEASSLRYVGHPSDMYKDSINMYFNEYFMGDEEFAYQNSPVLNYDNRAQSIIVPGTSGGPSTSLPTMRATRPVSHPVRTTSLRSTPQWAPCTHWPTTSPPWLSGAMPKTSSTQTA